MSSSIDSLTELIQQAQQLVLEEETVQQEHFSERLSQIGERLQERLIRAEERVLLSREQQEAAGRMHAEIIKLREHLDRVLRTAKTRLAEPASVEAPSSIADQT